MDEYGVITYCNRAATEIFGLDDGDDTSDIIGKPLLSFIAKKKNGQFEKYLKNAFNYFGYRGEKRRRLSGFGKRSDDESESVKIFDELPYEIMEDGVEFYGNSGMCLLNLCFRKLDDGRSRGLVLIAENISHKRTLKQTVRDSSVTFSAIITCITLYLIFWSLTEFTLDIHFQRDVYTKIIEGIAFLMFICIIAFTSLSLKDMGLFVLPRKFIRSLARVMPVTIVAIVVMILINLVARLFVGYEFKPKFIGGSPEGFINYLGVCILQEFLARGVIQTSVGNLIRFKWQRFSNVIIAAMIFSLMHLPFGFVFMMGSFVMGITLGIVYEKQQNIWGCVVLHWLVGYLAMAMFL